MWLFEDHYTFPHIKIINFRYRWYLALSHVQIIFLRFDRCIFFMCKSLFLNKFKNSSLFVSFFDIAADSTSFNEIAEIALYFNRMVNNWIRFSQKEPIYSRITAFFNCKLIDLNNYESIWSCNRYKTDTF